MKLYSKLIFFIIFVAATSCRDQQFGTPKPRTYPRVEFPKKKYQLFDSDSCNFQFEYPIYAKVIKDRESLNNKIPNDCWYNISFPTFNGNLFLTYYPINNRKDYDKMVDDSFELTSKHDIKASSRKEIKIKNNQNVTGLLFKVFGDVASETQFFLTDKKENFLRGSFYFKNKVNPDSIRVIQEFVDKDIEHFINTFTWK